MNAENQEGAKYKDLITAFQNKHVLVMGDLMLDRYITGKAHRISPEAPVPIVNQYREFAALGGAGNVAQNVITLGGKASLIGGVGQDNEAEAMKQIASHAGIAYAFMVDKNRPTTIKTRVIVDDQHMLRIDKETTGFWDITNCDIPMKMSGLQTERGRFDAIVISDYNKGFVTGQLMEYAHLCEVPIVVDPKTTGYSMFKGVNVLTPNESELTIYLQANAIDSTPDLIANLGVSGIIETKGRNGVRVWKPKPSNGCGAKPKDKIPGYVVPTLDVTGAGDTYAVAVALCLAGGESLEDAAEIANMAGAISVQCPGCYCPKQDELQQFNFNRANFSRSDMEM